MSHPFLGFEEELLSLRPLRCDGRYNLPPLSGVLSIFPLPPLPALASLPRHSQELPRLHFFDAVDEEATFQPLLPLLSFRSEHVFDSLGVVERLDQSDDGTLILLALLDPPSKSASVRRKVVVCADVCGLDAVDGGEVRSDVRLGHGLGDAEGGLVGVIRFSGRSKISDHSEDEVWEVDLLADHLSLCRSVLHLDQLCTTYPRPSTVELSEPFGLGKLPPVGSSEFSFCDAALVTSEFGGG